MCLLGTGLLCVHLLFKPQIGHGCFEDLQIFFNELKFKLKNENRSYSKYNFIITFC